MGHAKRQQSSPAAYPRRGAPPGSELDGHAVEQVLDWPLDRDDGDPISGIRNALIASAAFWLTLALIVAVLR